MRPTRDEYFVRMAKLVATRSTCLRRRVGCVLVSECGHVLATGYNGATAGVSHCKECVRTVSGESLDKCVATHAEQNALLQCPDTQKISACYVTTSPCFTCTKLLMNTSCKRIVFVEEYPQPHARELWVDYGRSWEHFK